jgi:hypothetical protein
MCCSDIQGKKILTVDEAPNTYEEVTDACRLVRATSDNARQWQQVKPDSETHTLAEFDQGSDVVKVGHYS